jgi:hypothetical protein
MKRTEHVAPQKGWVRWMQLAPALLVACFATSTGFAAFYAPPPTGELGVVFAPWVSEVEAVAAVAAAGGRLGNPSRLPNVLVAYAADPGFDARVRSRGAWFTVAARGLCGPVEGEQDEP